MREEQGATRSPGKPKGGEVGVLQTKASHLILRESGGSPRETAWGWADFTCCCWCKGTEEGAFTSLLPACVPPSLRDPSTRQSKAGPGRAKGGLPPGRRRHRLPAATTPRVVAKAACWVEPPPPFLLHAGAQLQGKAEAAHTHTRARTRARQWRRRVCLGLCRSADGLPVSVRRFCDCRDRRIEKPPWRKEPGHARRTPYVRIYALLRGPVSRSCSIPWRQTHLKKSVLSYCRWPVIENEEDSLKKSYYSTNTYLVAVLPLPVHLRLSSRPKYLTRLIETEVKQFFTKMDKWPC